MPKFKTLHTVNSTPPGEIITLADKAEIARLIDLGAIVEDDTPAAPAKKQAKEPEKTPEQIAAEQEALKKAEDDEKLKAAGGTPT